MIRLLLIVVITTHSCGYSTAATARSELDNILTDITNSICYLDFFQQAFLYLDFCRYDGFDRCGKLYLTVRDVAIASTVRTGMCMYTYYLRNPARDPSHQALHVQGVVRGVVTVIRPVELLQLR